MAMVMRLAPFFPARVLPGDGIEVIRTGGSVTIAMNWDNIQQASLPVDPENYEFTLRNEDGSFIRVPVQDIILPVVTWDTLSGKPSTFPPSAHTHPISEVDNLQITLDGLAASVANLTGASNVGLSASVAANALTINLTDASGNDPSSLSPVSLMFRSATAASGVSTSRLVTAATSLVISSGSTMGFANATAGRIWVVAFDDAGTVRLAAINCRSGVDIFRLGQIGIASSTAEGGAGAADNAHVFYTGTAVSSKAYVTLGYLEWASGITTAGTWDATPTRVEVFRPGVLLPGAIVQTRTGETNTFNSNAATIPFDNTPPQISEGTQAVSVSITPASSANVLRAFSGGTVGNSTSGVAVALALFRSDQTDALNAASSAISGVNLYEYLEVSRSFLSGTTSSITISSRFGGSSGTSAINGGSARQFGVSQVFPVEVIEIVA